MRKPKKPETILLYESQSFPLTPEIHRERRRAFIRSIAIAFMATACGSIICMEVWHVVVEPDVTDARWLRDCCPLYLGATAQAIVGAWLWAKYGER